MKSPFDNSELKTTFISEIERGRDPQARLISRSLWTDIFKREITSSQRELMQRRLKDCLDDPSFPAGIKADKMLTWSCIVSGNPTSLSNDMIQLAQLLKINSKELLLLACYVGNILLLDSIFQGKSNEEKLELIKYDNYCSYSGAKTQDLDVRAYLELQTDKLLNQELEKDNYKSAFVLVKFALKKGHHDVLFHLNKLLPNFFGALGETKHGGGVNDYHDLLCLASRLGGVELLKKLLHFSPAQVMLQNYKMVRAAGKGKAIEVLNYFEKTCPDLKRLGKFYEYEGIFDDYCAQARKGSLGTLKLIESDFGEEFVDDLIQHKDYQVFYAAAAGGHLKVIQHLENTLVTAEKCENMVNSNHFEGFLLAVANKKDDVAKHLLTYKSCYDYVSNNVRNESVVSVLRIFDDEQSKIEKLTQAIAKLMDYGKKLIEEDQDDVSKAEGMKTIHYATGLETLKNDFFKAKKVGNFLELNDLQNNFREQLAVGKDLMGTHRAEWKSIVAEIAIAFTGIGLLLIIGKYLITGNTFFSQTKRQKDVEEINHSFEEYFNQCN